ncbi:hypothetical protein, partial [Lentzea tibetensis]|uniref:hypothetical protein n=1 Tax=Lentzea tibetensis TaxID=2591470 RepID=UPI001C99C6D0
AHTLDIQLRTTNTRDTRDTTTLNPTATNPITIYRSHNHYTAHTNNPTTTALTTTATNNTTADTATNNDVLPPLIHNTITKLTNAGPTHRQNWPTTNGHPTDVDHYYGIPRFSTHQVIHRNRTVYAGCVDFKLPLGWEERTVHLARVFDRVIAWVPGATPGTIATLPNGSAVKVTILHQNHTHGTVKPGQRLQVMNIKTAGKGSEEWRSPNGNAWASLGAIGDTINWRIIGTAGSRQIEFRDAIDTLRLRRSLDQPESSRVRRRVVGNSAALPPEITAALLPITPSPLTAGAWPTTADGQPVDVSSYLNVPHQGGWTTPAKRTLQFGDFRIETPAPWVRRQVSFARKFDTLAIWIPGDEPGTIAVDHNEQQQYLLKKLKPIPAEGTCRPGQNLPSGSMAGYVGNATLRAPIAKAWGGKKDDVIHWKVKGDIGARYVEFYDQNGDLREEHTRPLDEMRESVNKRKLERTPSPDNPVKRSMFDPDGSHLAPPTMSRSGSDLSSVLEWTDQDPASSSAPEPEPGGGLDRAGESSAVPAAEDPVVLAAVVSLSDKLAVLHAAEARVIYPREAQERLSALQASACPMAKAIDAVYASETEQAAKVRNLVEIAKINRELADTPGESSPRRAGLEARLALALTRSDAMTQVALPDWYTSSDQLTDKTLDELHRLEAARAALRDASLHLDTATEQRNAARDDLSRDVDRLTQCLTADQFTWTATAALVTVSPGVADPDAARRQAQRQAALMLRNTHVAAQLLKVGVRVIITPDDIPLTSLPEFGHLAGTTTTDGRHWDDQKAAITGRTIAISEDALHNLPHEIAHAIHEHALDETDQLEIGIRYHHRFQQPNAPWPGTYATTDKYEAFAQLSTTYTGTNHGHVTNNSHIWPHKKWPEMIPLLKDIYEPTPHAITTKPTRTTDTPTQKIPTPTPTTISPSTLPATNPKTFAAYAKMRSTSSGNTSPNNHTTTGNTTTATPQHTQQTNAKTR